MLCLKGIGEKWEVGFTKEEQGRALQMEREGEGVNNTSDVWKDTGKVLKAYLSVSLRTEDHTSLALEGQVKHPA